MQKTKINWTDQTWNPASGCEKVSPECKFCYAETLSENKRGTPAFPVGFELQLRPHKLREPSKLKEPSLVFVNSMSDMFLAEIPDAFRDDCFGAMEAAPQHRYQVLTKRPQIAARYFATRRVPDCVWIGTSLGLQRYGGERLDALREVPARVRFISAEPLLEDLGELDLRGIHWLISGGESGLHLSQEKWLKLRALVRRGGKNEPRWVPREDRIDWVRSLRDQCTAAGVAFWHKQWGGPRPESGGRVLDGRTHDGMPDHVELAMPASRKVQLPLVG